MRHQLGKAVVRIRLAADIFGMTRQELAKRGGDAAHDPTCRIIRRTAKYVTAEVTIERVALRVVLEEVKRRRKAREERATVSGVIEDSILCALFPDEVKP